MENINQNAIDNLREHADFLEKHPNIGRSSYGDSSRSVTMFHDNKESLVTAMRELGGKWEKTHDEYFFTVRQEIGKLAVHMHVSRDAVCERRVTKKTLPATVETILPAKPERIVEEVEWVCPESILREADQASTIQLSDTIGKDDDTFAQR